MQANDIARTAPQRTLQAPAALCRPQLLVVDDDPDARRLMAKVLERDGLDVVEADGGIDLLGWVEMMAWNTKRHLFDAIVTDLQMPDMTALDVLSAFQGKPLPTPVILVTAFGDEMRRREAYELGVYAVLDKPLHPDDLRAVVHSVLKHPDHFPI